METKISLQNLTLDEIIKKFKALRNDSSIINMTLTIKRRKIGQADNQIEGRIKKSVTTGPQNVDKLFSNRKNNKQNDPTTVKDIGQDQKNQLKCRNSNKMCQQQCQQSQFSQIREDNFKNIQQIQPVQIKTRNQVVFSKYTNNGEAINFIKDKRLNKAIKYYSTANYDEAIRNFMQIDEELNEKLENILVDQPDKIQHNQLEEQEIKRNIANVTFHLGNCFVKKKNFDRALQYYMTTFPEESPKQRGIRKGNIAACYAYLKKNQLSLTHYKQALRLLSQFQQIDLSNIYYNIGAIYLEQQMYEASAKYLRLSVEQRKQKSSDNQGMLYNTYFKLGIALRGQEQMEQSLNCFNFALTYAERGVDSGNNSINEVSKQIALCYEILKKWNQAFAIYQNMLNSIEGSSSERAYIYRRVASIYRKGGNEGEYCKYLKLAADQYDLQGDHKTAQYIRQVK